MGLAAPAREKRAPRDERHRFEEADAACIPRIPSIMVWSTPLTRVGLLSLSAARRSPRSVSRSAGVALGLLVVVLAGKFAGTVLQRFGLLAEARSAGGTS